MIPVTMVEQETDAGTAQIGALFAAGVRGAFTTRGADGGDLVATLTGDEADARARAVARRLAESGGGPIWYPIEAGVSLPASGAALVDLGGPATGRRWSIRLLAANENLGVPTPNQATNTGAAGAISAASLPFFTPFLTGFDVSITPATAAGTTTITVSGGGEPNLVYNIRQDGTNPTNLSIRYPGSGLAGYTTVTVAAEVSGGAATVTVFGTNQSETPASLDWYFAPPLTVTQTPTLGLNQRPEPSGWRWRFPQLPGGQGNLPGAQNFSAGQMTLRYGLRLMCYVSGGLQNENLFLHAHVYDEPDRPGKLVYTE